MIQKIKDFFCSPRIMAHQAGLIESQYKLIEALRERVSSGDKLAEAQESESRLWGAAYDAEARRVQQMRKLVSDAIVTLNTLPSMPRTTKTDRTELVRVIKRIADAGMEDEANS